MSIAKDILSTSDARGLALTGVDATTTAARFEFNVERSSIASIQITLRTNTGSGSHSVWTIEQSLDGVEYAGLSTATTMTVIAGTVIVTGIDVGGVMSLRVRCSTAATYTTEIVDIVVMRGDWT